MNQPRKLDEVELWQAMRSGETMRDAAARLGVPRRRVEYLANKWARMGRYDWGTVCDLGWIIDTP